MLLPDPSFVQVTPGSSTSLSHDLVDRIRFTGVVPYADDGYSQATEPEPVERDEGGPSHELSTLILRMKETWRTQVCNEIAAHMARLSSASDPVSPAFIDGMARAAHVVSASRF